MYKIAKENLSALFQSIAENQELYLPVEVSGQVNYIKHGLRMQKYPWRP